MAAKTDWADGDEVNAAALNTLGTEVNSTAITPAQTSKLAGIATNATANPNTASIPGFAEDVQDIIGTKLVAGSNIAVDYNDVTGETIIATGGGGTVTPIVDFGFAVGFEMNQNPAQTELAAIYYMAKQAFAKRVRISISPHATGPGPSYNWTTADNQVNAAVAAGLDPFIHFEGPRNTAGTQMITPTVAIMVPLVTAAVARYKDRCNTWDILNEINHIGFWGGGVQNVPLYKDILQGCYTAIHAAQPTATVVTGGSASCNTVNNTGSWDPAPRGIITYSPEDFLTQLYAAGGGPYFDAVGWHPYTLESGIEPTGPAPTAGGVAMTRDTAIRAVMVANGDGAKKIWWTEVGYPTTSDTSALGYQITLAQQADYMAALLDLASQRVWVGPVLMYDIRNVGTDSTATEQNYGAYTNAGLAKPIVARLAQILAVGGGGSGGGGGVTPTNAPLKLYGTDDTGDQTLWAVSVEETADSIPVRGVDGTMKTATPTTGDHVATKAYVDAAAGAGGSGVTPTATPLRIYGTNDVGAQTTYPLAVEETVANSIPVRDVDGKLKAADPTANDHVATKSYVDAAGEGGADLVLLSSKMIFPDPGPYPTTRLTFTVTATAPTYTGMQYLAFNTHAARFRFSAPLTNIGGWGFCQISGATGGFGVTSSEIEQDVYGADCAYMVQSFGLSDYYVEVDGTTVGKGWEHYTGAGTWFLKFTFLDGKPVHRIRIILGAIGFGQLLIPATGTAWPAPPRFRVLSVGDSWGHGGESAEGTISAGTLNGCMRRRAGWDMIEMAQGGTGYKNPGAGSGSSIYGSTGRVAAAVALPFDPDMIFLYGGANDGSYTPIADTVTLAESCWSAYAAAFPDVPIIVSGVESGVYPSIATALDNLDIALQNAAEAHPDVVAYIPNRRTTPAWVYGTGDRSAFANDGNADFAVSGSDHVHPTEFAWDYIHARLILDQMKPIRVHQNLAPAPPVTPPPGPVTPPVVTGTLLSGYSALTAVFRPEWTQPAAGNAHFTALTTAAGAGYDFTATDADVPTWDVNTKAILAQKTGLVTEGLTQRWTYNMYLPTQTLTNTWHVGVLWEFHTNSGSGHHIALNNDGTFRFGRQKSLGTDASNFVFTTGPAVPWNTWITVRLDMKWSQGSTGFYQLWLNGVQYINFTGPTTFASDGLPVLQFGWYSLRGASLTNKVTIADIRYTNL